MSEISGWQRRRSRFNHDWLQNHFLVKLNAGIRLLNKEVEDKYSEKRFVSDLFEQWLHNTKDAIQIANEYYSGMSPRILMEQQPLLSLDESSKQWLSFVIHELWLSRENIDSLVDVVLDRAEEAHSVYNEIQNAIEINEIDQASVSSLCPLLPLFVKWRDCCQSLSQSISQFPKEIKVA